MRESKQIKDNICMYMATTYTYVNRRGNQLSGNPSRLGLLLAVKSVCSVSFSTQQKLTKKKIL